MIIVRNMNIKGYSAEGSERGLSGRFLSLSLYDHINRNKKRVLLIRSQMKVRKGSHVIRWQEAWLNCVLWVSGKLNCSVINLDI